MKYPILFIITVVFYSITFSQNISIKKGTEFTPEDNSTFNYYIDNDATGVYIGRTSTKGKGITKVIQKLDPITLSTLYSAEYHLDKLEETEGTYLKNNKILVFTSKYDKEEQIKYFLLREFDSKTGNILGERKQISALKSDGWGVSGRNFYITFSPDETKLAITNEFRWPKKASEVQTTIYETSTFKKLGAKTVIDAYANSTIGSFNYRLDNSGTFYYLFNYMKDFEEEIGGLAIASIQADATKTLVTPLPFDKLAIQNGTFEFVNNNLVFCGVFKDVVTKKEKKEGKLQDVGVYSFFIDGKSGEVKNKGFDYFPQNIKDKLTYRDGLIEESPAKKFYSFEEIFTFNDNVYLIESHSYAISSNNSYVSYERELIVSKFNKEGKLEWMKIIPKFTANNLNNFNYIVRNNKVYLFYAEHPKNLEKSTVTDYDAKKYADIKNYNGSVLVCTVFDEKGNLSRKEVLRNEGWCYDPISKNIIIDKDNGLLLRMINKNQERYDKITLD